MYVIIIQGEESFGGFEWRGTFLLGHDERKDVEFRQNWIFKRNILGSFIHLQDLPLIIYTCHGINNWFDQPRIQNLFSSFFVQVILWRLHSSIPGRIHPIFPSSSAVFMLWWKSYSKQMLSNTVADGRWRTRSVCNSVTLKVFFCTKFYPECDEQVQSNPVTPLSPSSDEDQISPNNIHTLSRHKLWELIKWSHKRKCLDLSSNSLYLFFMEISLENLYVDSGAQRVNENSDGAIESICINRVSVLGKSCLLN